MSTKRAFRDGNFSRRRLGLPVFRFLVILSMLSSMVGFNFTAASAAPASAPGITAPGQATLISPSGFIATYNPTYSWNEVADAEGYYLQVNDPNVTAVIQTSYDTSVCSGGVCSVTPGTTLGGGIYTWAIRTWNSAEGWGPWSDLMTFSMAPGTTITSSPPNPTNNTSATFEFDSDDPNATFECKLDSASFSACTSPKNYTGLSSGSHTFQVRAIETLGGNPDPTPASHTWTIDTTPPDTSITSSPSNPTNSTSATFEFTATEGGSTFQCKLDSGSYASCTSPKDYTGLSGGSHTFQVYATDALGNPDPTPASYTWTIDTTPPNTSITSNPPNPTNSTSATFEFTATEGGSTFQCKLDSGSYASCTSPKTYTGLGSGSHTFQVYATDALGNPDPTPASYTWTIDTTPPDTSITSSPPNPTASTGAAFEFTATEGGSTFQCKLDGGSYASCTSPKTYTGLSGGSHTFQVYATDALGNADPTPASYTWTIDTTPPNTSITSNPPNPTASTSAVFNFESDDPGATFQCKLDGGSYASCASPKTYTGLGSGSHTFQVYATDALGNADPTPASYTWTIDTSAPDTSITDSPADPSNSTSATFEFTATEGGSTFQCKLDGGSYASCASPKTYTGLSDGSHTFQVYAVDTLGNADPTPASYTWTIDTTPPNTSITGSPANPTNSPNASFSFTSTEGGSTFQCKLDGGSYSSCSSPKPYTGLSDGSHTFQVYATDALGNPDPTPATYTWTIDTTPPNTSITSNPPNPSASTTAVFSFTSTEGGSTFQCKLDGGSYASCTSPKTYTGLGIGSHTFQVYAADAVGNVDLSPASHTWTVDTDIPSVTSITRVNPDPTNAASVEFSVTFSESVTGVDTLAPFADFNLVATGLTGAAITGVTGSGSVYTVTVATGSGEGTLRLDVVDDDSIQDSAGNKLGGTDPGNGDFTGGEVYNVDTLSPTVTSVTRAHPNPTRLASVNFTVTFSESVTGVETTAPFSGFGLVTTGVAGAEITGVTGSGNLYTVTVSTGTGNGTIHLDVLDNDSILDNLGNPLGGIGIGNGDFTSGETYDVNKNLISRFRSMGAYDGWVLESGEFSNKGGLLNAAATTFSLGDDASDKQYRAILHFNTVTLPDKAVIVSVKLKIKAQRIVGTNPFSTHKNIIVDVKKGLFSNNKALQSLDFQAVASKGWAGVIKNNPAAGNWYIANLKPTAFSFINLKGTTQIRLRFQVDDNDDMSADMIKFFSGNHSTFAYRPLLIVEYYIP